MEAEKEILISCTDDDGGTFCGGSSKSKYAPEQRLNKVIMESFWVYAFRFFMPSLFRCILRRYIQSQQDSNLRKDV